MRWLNILLLLLVAGAGYGLTLMMDSRPPPPAPPLQKSAPVADFMFVDLAGKSHSLHEFKGRIVLLNFWATWCAPCIREFPALLEIAAANKQDVVLIALSSDIDESAVSAFLQKIKKPTKNVYIALDKNDITSKLFGISQFPETIVADRALVQIKKIVGAEWTPEEMQKTIDSVKTGQKP